MLRFDRKQQNSVKQLSFNWEKKMKFIISPLGSGLFWCFSSSKSRSRGFAHFFSFSKNAVTIIWMSWTSLLKDKSPPRGAELSSPRWGHSRSAPNQSIASYVSTCSIAEDRCLPEPCWNTSQLIDLWAKIKNAVACCEWILRNLRNQWVAEKLEVTIFSSFSFFKMAKKDGVYKIQSVEFEVSPVMVCEKLED